MSKIKSVKTKILTMITAAAMALNAPLNAYAAEYELPEITITGNIEAEENVSNIPNNEKSAELTNNRSEGVETSAESQAPAQTEKQITITGQIEQQESEEEPKAEDPQTLQEETEPHDQNPPAKSPEISITGEIAQGTTVAEQQQVNNATNQLVENASQDTSQASAAAQSVPKTISRKVGTTTVQVKGMLPEGVTLSVIPISNIQNVENIINNSGEALLTFEAQKAYDITLFDVNGLEYQPIEHGTAVEVIISDPELSEVDNAKIYRIEDNNKDVTQLSVKEEKDVTVSFETEHFTTYVIGGVTYDTNTLGVTKTHTQGGLTWTLYDNGLLVGTGTAGITAASNLFYRSSDPFYEYRGQVKTIYCDCKLGEYSSEYFAYFNTYTGHTFENFVTGPNFSTSNVKHMYGMFSYCKSLKTIDLHGFNTSNALDLKYMFEGCESLETLDLSSFNTSNMTDMKYMFEGCKSLKTINLSSFNTSNITDMSYMFDECNALTTLDLSNFNTSNVTKMTCMFRNCSSLETLNLSSFNTLNVTSMSTMFKGCNTLTSLDLSGFNTSNVTSMRNMFESCSSLGTLNLNSFNTLNVTDMCSMFNGCNTLTVLNIDNFNTSNVTDMSYMFSDCKVLIELNLSSFNTSKVTNMSYMFNRCSVLTTLDLSNFNTSNVTKMSYMFNGCNALTTLDLSNFNTSNVTSMSYMFNACSALTTLDLSNFNTSNVTSMSHMFSYDKSINILDLSNFDILTGTTSYIFYKSNIKVLKTPKTTAYRIDLDSSDFYKPLDINEHRYNCENVTAIPKDLTQSETYYQKKVVTYYDADKTTVLTKEYVTPGETITYENENITLWKLVSTNAVYDKTAPVTQDLRLYANGSSVTIKYMDGNVVYRSESVQRDGEYSLTSNTPTYEEKKFLYWTDSSGNRYAPGAVYGNVTENIVFTANYENRLVVKYLCNNEVFKTEYADNGSDYHITTERPEDTYVARFNNWRIGDTIYEPGADYGIVSSDVTFVANMAMMQDVTTLAGPVTRNGHTWILYQNNNSGRKILAGSGDGDPTGTASDYQVKDLDSHFIEAQDVYCDCILNKNSKGMFWGMTNIETFTVGSNFNTSRISTMWNFFRQCESLITIDVSYFDMSNVESTKSMFNQCYNLKSCRIHWASTPKLNSMGWMFEDCRSLEEIDLSYIDASHLKSNDDGKKEMFVNCNSLKVLKTPKKTPSNIDIPLTKVKGKENQIHTLYKPANPAQPNYNCTTVSNISRGLTESETYYTKCIVNYYDSKEATTPIATEYVTKGDTIGYINQTYGKWKIKSTDAEYNKRAAVTTDLELYGVEMESTYTVTVPAVIDLETLNDKDFTAQETISVKIKSEDPDFHVKVIPVSTVILNGYEENKSYDLDVTIGRNDFTYQTEGMNLVGEEYCGSTNLNINGEILYPDVYTGNLVVNISSRCD